MKGTHISKKAQKRLLIPKKHFRDMSIAQLSKLADKGDEKAKMWLRRFCGCC